MRDSIANVGAGETSLGQIRGHLREAGVYVLFSLGLYLVQSGLSYLSNQTDGFVHGGLLIVSMIATFGAIANGVIAAQSVVKAGYVAWEIDRLRKILAVGLIVMSIVSVSFSYVHFTTESELYDEEIDAAQDERQSAIDAAAATDDPGTVRKQMAIASEAEADIEMYRLYEIFWRIILVLLGLAMAGFTFLPGVDGLITSSRSEVNHTDV